MNSPALSIKRLTPQSLPQFLQFFDGNAFSDNPKWSSCYCQCFYENHAVVNWSDCTAERNRAMACDRTLAGAMQGYIALAGEDPIGWCGASPRHLLHALDDERTPDGAPAAPVDNAPLCGSVAHRRRLRQHAHSPRRRMKLKKSGNNDNHAFGNIAS